MITLAPEFALAIIVALISGAGSFFAVKFAGAETQRLVKALHGRFDHLETEVGGIKIQQARQDERIKGLRESQRFTLRAKLEAAQHGQPPMFASDEGEDG